MTHPLMTLQETLKTINHSISILDPTKRATRIKELEEQKREFERAIRVLEEV